jgi:hypothetical protein
MRALTEAWPEPDILQSLIAKLPWRHNLRVPDRIKDRPTREWYLRAALEYGWSQDVLVLQNESGDRAMSCRRLYFKVRAYPWCLIFSRRPFAAAFGSFAP